MKFEVTIVNATARESAYAQDRRPEPGEAKRVLELEAPSRSHLNGIVQERMWAQGYQRDDWKIMSWKRIR